MPWRALNCRNVTFEWKEKIARLGLKFAPRADDGLIISSAHMYEQLEAISDVSAPECTGYGFGIPLRVRL
jgi:hypothetical protein